MASVIQSLAIVRSRSYIVWWEGLGDLKSSKPPAENEDGFSAREGVSYQSYPMGP